MSDNITSEMLNRQLTVINQSIEKVANDLNRVRLPLSLLEERVAKLEAEIASLRQSETPSQTE